MAQTSLRKAHTGVLENSQGAAQEVVRRYEVGVEDGDQRRAGEVEAMGEGGGLETITCTAPDMDDVDPSGAPLRRTAADDQRRLVVRVVEDLHLDAVAWPFHLADGVDHALGYVALVVDRDLHADVWFMAEWHRAGWRLTDASGAPRQVEKVHPEAQEANAQRGEDAKRDCGYRGDHAASGSSKS